MGDVKPKERQDDIPGEHIRMNGQGLSDGEKEKEDVCHGDEEKSDHGRNTAWGLF
jgi:hypothetical protein